MNQIDARTRYCAVFGHPISHSASPAMQNAGLAALGLNWRYLAFDVRPERLSEALAGARRMGFMGLNLTVPHKVLAMELVQAGEEAVRIWGAINTVAFEGQTEDGRWRPLREFGAAPVNTRAVGFNTDAEAIPRAIREDLGIDLRRARVLLLGAGGAGRTAALRAAWEGASELYLVNRTEARARELAREIAERYPATRVEAGYPAGTVDLVVNATSVGLQSEAWLPFETARFALERAGAVFDMIYRPAETPLLKAAARAGCKTANGLGMLLHQGTRALEIWTGQPAPVETMRQALKQNVYG